MSAISPSLMTLSRLGGRWYPGRGRTRVSLRSDGAALPVRRQLTRTRDRAARADGRRRARHGDPKGTRAPMPDLVRLETELTARYPEPWVRHHLAAFRAAYFSEFDAADVSRHLGRILALTDEQPVAVDVWPEGPGTWRVEAVGYDAFQLLSTLCTLLAIHGLSIVDGLAFTSDPREAPPPSHPAPRRWRRPGRPPSPTAPGEPDRRPRIVDRFLVRWAGDDEGEPDWDAFRAELTELARLLRAGRSEEVHHRLIPRFVAVMGRYR